MTVRKAGSLAIMTLVMSMNLNIYVEERGDVTVVTVSGPVDSATFDQFREKIDPLGHAPGAKLVINASGMTYINSKGIGLLASLHRALLVSMGNMVLCGLSKRIMKTLELLGLANRLHVFATVDEALAFFKPQA